MRVNNRERERLRELAKRQMEISQFPQMGERLHKWYRLNNGELCEPLVTFEFNGPPELVYPTAGCEDPLAREVEARLIWNVYSHDLLGDDRVISPFVPVPVRNRFTAFGISNRRVYIKNPDGGDGMAYRFDHPIKDLEKDFHLIGKSEYIVDRALKDAKRRRDEINEVIGDILPAKIEFASLGFCPAAIFCALMGIEPMLLAMYDCPETLHKAMGMLVEDFREYMRAIENTGAILPNNDGSYLNQGSWGYTTDLPSAGERDGFTIGDVWGYTNSQETVGMSAEMFDEFFFPYIAQIAGEFGLLAYGCCEPVDKLWDRCLSRLTNLRKLSVSPWCDEEAIAMRIRGHKIVYHRKPSPNYISVDDVFDEQAFRAHMRKTAIAARGCPLEITFRDVIDAKGEPERLGRAVSIAKEECARHWRP